MEGDYVGAGASAIALIPVGGQGAIVLKYGDEASAIVRNADNAPSARTGEYLGSLTDPGLGTGR